MVPPHSLPRTGERRETPAPARSFSERARHAGQCRSTRKNARCTIDANKCRGPSTPLARRVSPETAFAHCSPTRHNLVGLHFITVILVLQRVGKLILLLFPGKPFVGRPVPDSSLLARLRPAGLQAQLRTVDDPSDGLGELMDSLPAANLVFDHGACDDADDHTIDMVSAG